MEASSYKKASHGAMVSIIAYVCLSIFKIGVSYITASNALLADGWNNLTDIGASLAVLIGLKISQKPRDSDHPYGHSRAEQIASLVASFIMMSIGGNVIIQAGRSFLSGPQESPHIGAAWMALFCAAVMYAVYSYNRSIARLTKSKALEAAAKDNLSDMFVSIGTVIGVLTSQFGMPIIDSLAAVIIGLIICKTAWGIFMEASHMLTDGIDPEKMQQYRETVQSIDGVDAIVDMKGRMYGNDMFVDITIQVNAYMDIVESHMITDTIEHKLMKEHGVIHSHIHVEPSVMR